MEIAWVLLAWLESIYSWNQLTLSSIPVNLPLKWAIQWLIPLLVLYFRCWTILLRRNKACFQWKRKKLLSIRIAEKLGRWFLAAHERGYWLAPRNALRQYSYRLEVRPRSTSNEFLSRVINRLSQIIIINLADYSSDTTCDLSTVKRRDWTRHEHYNMLYMWRIHYWV